jgi:hypothetical protein
MNSRTGSPSLTLGRCFVGQDGILRADWQPAPGGHMLKSYRRVANPPQVDNLPA